MWKLKITPIHAFFVVKHITAQLGFIIKEQLIPIPANKVVYSLTVEDLQAVALEVLERELSEDEIAKVEEKHGDYIGWFDAIELAIQEVLPIQFGVNQ